MMTWVEQGGYPGHGEYHKIQTCWLRDPSTNYQTLLERQWARPEFDLLQHAEWVFTEKVDGTNIRIHLDDDIAPGRPATGDPLPANIAGRTDRAQLPQDLLEAIGAMDLPYRWKDQGLPTMTLYGEGYGAGIQKGGGLYREHKSFILFDVRIGHVWLERENILGIAEALNLDVVPIVGRGTLHTLVDQCRDGFPSRISHQFRPAEGLVAKPAVELMDRRGRRIITKLKVSDFEQSP